MLRQSECIYARFMVIFSKNPSDWERKAKKGASDIVTSVKKSLALIRKYSRFFPKKNKSNWQSVDTCGMNLV